MFSYPIVVPPLSPKDARKFPPGFALKMRKQPEDYLNERAENSSGIALIYSEIAQGAGIDPEAVKLFLRKMTGHGSGITVGNSDLKKEMGD